MIKAIFWDNDGVLVDTERLFFQANRETLATKDIELDQDGFVRFFLKSSAGIDTILKNHKIVGEEIQSLRFTRNQRYSELLGQESLSVDGAENVLRTLHGRLLMGIVTSSRKDHFDRIHDQTGFSPYFDFVIANEDCQRTKPDPEPYLKALQRSGLKKEECLVIEDSERGLTAAKRAGLACWVIPNPLIPSGGFSEADIILNHINEIPEKISKFME